MTSVPDTLHEEVDIIILRHGALPAERIHELGLEPAVMFAGFEAEARTEYREVDTGPYTPPRQEMKVSLTTEWKEISHG
jgi:hypothetical protein